MTALLPTSSAGVPAEGADAPRHDLSASTTAARFPDRGLLDGRLLPAGVTTGHLPPCRNCYPPRQGGFFSNLIGVRGDADT